jgi:hypothetical protein
MYFSVINYVYLKYLQRKMDLIEEIMQLPIFVVARKQPTSLMFNMKVLCYIKTGKIKLAAEILKDFTCSYNDSYPIIFDEVVSIILYEINL